MSLYNVTARLIENWVEVETAGERYAVYPRDDEKRYGICPVEYLAGSLGS